MMKDLTKLSDTERAYIAGLLDRAMFSIDRTVSRKKIKNYPIYQYEVYSIVIILAHKNPLIIEWIYSFVGGKICYRSANSKIISKWTIRGIDAINLLNACYIYLKAKRRHANIFFLWAPTLRKSKNLNSYFQGSALTPETRNMRKNLFSDMVSLNAEGGKVNNNKARISIEYINSNLNLFDFIPDSDGFGEMLIPRAGFFDDFITQLQYEEQE